MEKKINVNFGNLKIHQLGHVYRDIEKQAKIMESTYGFPKFTISDAPNLEIIYRGKKSVMDIKFGFSRLLNTQVELIQWNGGECIYKEFINEGKEGLHHLGVYVEDLQLYIDDFQKKGIEVLESGVMGSLNLAYMDTEKSFGILLELFEPIKRRRRKK